METRTIRTGKSGGKFTVIKTHYTPLEKLQNIGRAIKTKGKLEAGRKRKLTFSESCELIEEVEKFKDNFSPKEND